MTINDGHRLLDDVGHAVRAYAPERGHRGGHVAAVSVLEVRKQRALTDLEVKPVEIPEHAKRLGQRRERCVLGLGASQPPLEHIVEVP
jgi:hypothetical protein